MTAEGIAAELRAGWAGSWVIRGIDRAEHFGRDLAGRGVRSIVGAKVEQVGTSRQVIGTDWQALNMAGDSGASVDLVADVPVYRVRFADGLSLGYGDGFKGYNEDTLKPEDQTLARSTEGSGAVRLRVLDVAGKAVLFPEWESTSDQSDILAILAGVGAVITAGLTLGAAPAAGAATTTATAATAAESVGLLGVDLTLAAPTAAVDLAGAGVASWGAAGAELGTALFAELSPGLILAGGAGAAAGAAGVVAELSATDAAMLDLANAAPLTPATVAPAAAAPGALQAGLQQVGQTVSSSLTKALSGKLTASLLSALGLTAAGQGADQVAPAPNLAEGAEGAGGAFGPVAAAALVSAVLFVALG